MSSTNKVSAPNSNSTQMPCTSESYDCEGDEEGCADFGDISFSMQSQFQAGLASEFCHIQIYSTGEDDKFCGTLIDVMPAWTDQIATCAPHTHDLNLGAAPALPTMSVTSEMGNLTFWSSNLMVSEQHQHSNRCTDPLTPPSLLHFFIFISCLIHFVWASIADAACPTSTRWMIR